MNNPVEQQRQLSFPIDFESYSSLAKDLAYSGLFSVSTEDASAHTTRRLDLTNGRQMEITGPTLTTRDEDTILAANALALQTLINDRPATESIPLDLFLLPDESAGSEDAAPVSAYWRSRNLSTIVTVWNLDAYLGYPRGGKTSLLRHESLDRISKVQYKIISPAVEAMTSSPLLIIDKLTSDVSTPNEQLRYRLTFPQATQELFRDAILISIPLRNQLSPLGKFMHRELVFQGFQCPGPEGSHIQRGRPRSPAIWTIGDIIRKSRTSYRPKVLLDMLGTQLGIMQSADLITDWEAISDASTKRISGNTTLRFW